jgi:hypothetical protein
VLDFAPAGALTSAEADPRRRPQASDPVEICKRFVEFTSGGEPDDEQLAVLTDVIETVQHADAADSGSLAMEAAA